MLKSFFSIVLIIVVVEKDGGCSRGFENIEASPMYSLRSVDTSGYQKPLGSGYDNRIKVSKSNSSFWKSNGGIKNEPFVLYL